MAEVNTRVHTPGKTPLLELGGGDGGLVRCPGAVNVRCVIHEHYPRAIASVNVR